MIVAAIGRQIEAIGVKRLVMRHVLITRHRLQRRERKLVRYVERGKFRPQLELCGKVLRDFANIRIGVLNILQCSAIMLVIV